MFELLSPNLNIKEERGRVRLTCNLSAKLLRTFTYNPNIWLQTCTFGLHFLHGCDLLFGKLDKVIFGQCVQLGVLNNGRHKQMNINERKHI